MSDVVKWTLLLGGAIVFIGLIIVLDPIQFIDENVFGNAITTIINIAGEAFNFGRGIINNLLSPWAREALSGLIYWIIGKELILWGMKVSVWAYHYLFK